MEMQIEPVRIIHVFAAMNRAGAETMIMNLYRNIDRNKVQFDFAVSATRLCDYDGEISQLGGRIFHYPRYCGKNHFVYKKWWCEFFETHEEYEIVHGHIGSTAAIYLNIARKYNRYTIAHSHSTTPKISLNTISYKIYSYNTRYIADYFFGCSQEAILSRYGKRIASNKNISKVLNNAIDAKKYIFNNKIRDKVREEFHIHADEFILGTVGRLTTVKNPYGIIKILKVIKEKGVAFRFLWVGEGEMKKDIIKQIHKENLEIEVILVGARADVNRLLQAMDVFLFPSLWEGLGMACIEAQAAGLPTICSDTIPREAGITKLCSFLPLNNEDLWAEKVLSLRGIERCDTYDDIVRSGYDITLTARWLQDFYMDKIQYH